MMNEPGGHELWLGWGFIIGFVLLLAVIWIVARVTIHYRKKKIARK